MIALNRKLAVPVPKQSAKLIKQKSKDLTVLQKNNSVGILLDSSPDREASKFTQHKPIKSGSKASLIIKPMPGDEAMSNDKSVSKAESVYNNFSPKNSYKNFRAMSSSGIQAFGNSPTAQRSLTKRQGQNQSNVKVYVRVRPMSQMELVSILFI